MAVWRVKRREPSDPVKQSSGSLISLAAVVAHAVFVAKVHSVVVVAVWQARRGNGFPMGTPTSVKPFSLR